MSRALFFLFFVLPVGCTSAPEESTSDEIRIGLIASLTGPAGEQGKNWMRGAKLAAKELKAKGVKLSLVVEDDRTLPAETVKSVQKLVHVDNVDALVGGTWDYLVESASPIEQQSMKLL